MIGLAGIDEMDGGRGIDAIEDENRKQLVLEGKLADKIADPESGLDDAVFADDMGPITDMKVGPDGYLYALIYGSDDGKIVRILPTQTE